MVNIQANTISILVDIGRGIFQQYFTPTAFKKFDQDYKLTQIIQALFWENPAALLLLETKAPELRQELTQINALQILQKRKKIDFEVFIESKLWDHPETLKIFYTLLERIEKYENDAKKNIFEKIKRSEILTEVEYQFLFELIIYERCTYPEFQYIYKFIRNIQYIWFIILENITSIKNDAIKWGFIKLVQEKGTKKERDFLENL